MGHYGRVGGVWHSSCLRYLGGLVLTPPTQDAKEDSGLQER